MTTAEPTSTAPERVAAFLDAWEADAAHASKIERRLFLTQWRRGVTTLFGSDLRELLKQRTDLDNEADQLNADLEEAQATVARLRDQIEQDCS